MSKIQLKAFVCMAFAIPVIPCVYGKILYWFYSLMFESEGAGFLAFMSAFVTSVLIGTFAIDNIEGREDD